MLTDTDNDVTLLPCPFCGGEARRFTLGEEEPGNAGGDVITCARCGASSHVEFGRKENLVSRWNTRANQAPANASVVEALVNVLTKHHQWHAAQTDPDPSFGFVPADEYADSALYDETVRALALAHPVVNLASLPATPEPAEEGGLVEELATQIEKVSGPNGWDWLFPLRVAASDGKPLIASHKGGNLFRGYIATWQPADFLVWLANHAPAILTALQPTGQVEAMLRAQINEACKAGDAVLAPICAKVGRYLVENPELNAVPVMADYEVHLTFGDLQRLYRATDRTALADRAADQLQALGDGQ